MNAAWRRWASYVSILMMASVAAAAGPEIKLQLIQGKAGKTPGDEIRRICSDKYEFEVYSPDLVVHTMKADEMVDPLASVQSVFGQGESRIVFDHALSCDRCPEGGASAASVSTHLDGRQLVLGVLFPMKGEDPDLYRVRIQEMRDVRPTVTKDGAVGGVIPPTLINVPVRCPPGHVGVVGFADFKGRPLFLLLTPRR